MISHELRKYVSFKCHSCQGEAQVTVADERIERVDCLACVVMVELHDATLMYDTLIKRYSLQEARNISRRLLRDRGWAAYYSLRLTMSSPTLSGHSSS